MNHEVLLINSDQLYNKKTVRFNENVDVRLIVIEKGVKMKSLK